MEVEVDHRTVNLVIAARDGDLEKVKQLVSNETLNRSSVVGWFSGTALGIACHSGSEDVAAFLIEAGSDVNIKSNDDTPLHFACIRGLGLLVQALINHGARVNEKNWNEKTALHMACEADFHEIVQILLANGADVNAVDGDSWTPLHLSRSGRVALTLIEHGAEIHARDSEECTPLQRVGAGDNINLLATLLDYNTDSVMTPCYHFLLNQDCHRTAVMCLYVYCRENHDRYRDFLRCFEEHFIKVSSSGLYSVEAEKAADPPEIGLDWSNLQRNAFQAECKEELSKMKIDTICGCNVSYFSLLARNLTELRGQYITIDWDRCRQTYPIYGNIIHLSYLRLKRFFLTDRSVPFFSLTFPRLPPECAEQVLGYLPVEDLLSLAEVCSRAGILPGFTFVN